MARRCFVRSTSALAAAGLLSLAACGDDTTGTGGGGGHGGSTQASTTAPSTGTGGGAEGGSDATTTSSSTATGSASSGAGGAAEGDAPTEQVDLAASAETLLNPERGFYSAIDLLAEDDLSWVTERGHSLVYSYVMLDEHRDEPLPDTLLAEVAASMQTLREAGLKVVLRFAYNQGPYPDADPDAPLEQVLEHIEQLAPVLLAQKDVIAVLQAGFIGAWGEWHTSTNGLDEEAPREAILQAILDALPADRSVVVRLPAAKLAMFGGALAEAEAFSGSDASRTGHHNDCFLASDTDLGTYPSDGLEEMKQYVADDTRFVPMGGETCAPNPPRSECASALAEMERLHFTFLNEDYHQDVIDSWVDDGCKEEMDQRLGYRLVLTSADVAPALRPGGRFVLRLRIRNDGFAAPINPRPLHAVITQGGERFEVELPGSDARRLPAGEETEVAYRLHVPATLADGAAQLSLRLPDPRLGDDPRQAIQLANEGTWDEATGDNRVAEITLAADAEGAADDGLTDLVAEQAF